MIKNGCAELQKITENENKIKADYTTGTWVKRYEQETVERCHQMIESVEST